MDRIPRLSIRTLTLACALILFGGSLNVLYADNDPCYKKVRCPGPPKRVRSRERRSAKPGSQIRQLVAENVPRERPRGGSKNSIPSTRRGRRVAAPAQPEVSSVEVSPVVSSGLSFTAAPASEPPVTGQSNPSPFASNLVQPAATTGTSIVSGPGNTVEEELQYGYTLIAARKHKEATKQFTAILANSPLEARAYVGIGDVHMAKGRHSKAITAYRKALELDPQNTALSDRLKEAIAIEKEQDKVARDRWIKALLQVGLGAALGATQKQLEPKQLQPFQFGNRVPPLSLQPLSAPKQP